METLQIPDGQEFNFFDSRIPKWSGWLASFVVDQQGNHAGVDGSSKSISNNLDLQLLLALRSKCSVIVTTGATARAEEYKSSRFAPIAFLTKNRNSLNDVPAVNSPGTHPNIFLDSKQVELNFLELSIELRKLGFEGFLFEGGPSVLNQLLSSDVPVQLVLSVVTSELSIDTAFVQAQPVQFLNRELSSEFNMTLVDDFIAGRNRITRWVKKAT